MLFSFLLSLYLPRLKPSGVFKPLQHEERSCLLLQKLLDDNNIRLAKEDGDHEKRVRLVKAMIYPVGMFKENVCVM